MIAQRPNHPNYYGPMLDFSDVEYALENGRKFNLPNVPIKFGEDWKLAKRILKNGEWWTGVFEHKEKLNAEVAFYAVSQGYTLIINRAQSVIPNVYQASWQLEEALGWLVNTNLYLTPSGGAQGFEAHIDWMDGFIFQTAGTKRWKSYDPPLIVFPRPDMTKRPGSDFLLNRGNSTTHDPNLPPPPHEFVLRSGDLAYIPRGIVHEACTSSVDLSPNPSATLDELHPYHQPSMHLTFGLEVARDYTVESLLHHYITTQFKFHKWGGADASFADVLHTKRHSCSAATTYHPSCFVTNSLAENEPGGEFQTETIRFESDSGLFHFDLIISSQSQDEDSFSLNKKIYFEDFLHLLLSFVSIDTSSDSTFNPFASIEDLTVANSTLDQTYVLRKAVGVNQFTSSVTELDPRRLNQLGAKIFLENIPKLGLSAFFNYLIEHEMVSISSFTLFTEEKKNQDEKNDFLSSLWNQIRTRTSISHERMTYKLKNELTLYPSPIQEEYVTLGSDKGLTYLNKFLSHQYLEDNQRIFDISVLVTSKPLEGQTQTNILNQHDWNELQLLDEDQTISRMNPNIVRTLMKSQSWKRAEEDIQQILREVFALNDSKQNDRNMCSSYARMINTIKEDKQKRKVNGLAALRHAGHSI